MNLLKQVQVGRQAPRLRDLWYGEPGVGKTSLAAETDRPLFVSLDDGATKLNVARVRPRSIPELRALLAELAKGGHGYRTLVIDVLDEVERWIAVDVAETYRGDKGERYTTCAEIPFGRGYAMAIDRHWRPLLADLEQMQAKTGMGLVLLAWASEGRQGGEDGAPVTQWKPRLQDSARVSAAGLVYGWCENVLFLTRQRTATVGNVRSFDAREKTGRQIGTAPRVIRTEADGPWMAKNRCPGMPPSLSMDGGPADTWAALRPYLLGAPQVAEEVRARIRALGEDPQVADQVGRAGDDVTKLIAVEKWAAGRAPAKEAP